MKLADHPTIFDAKSAEKIAKLIDDVSDDYEISPHVVEDLLIAEAIPVDDRRWPKSWIVTGKRFKTILEGLDPLYFEAFNCCYPSNVKKVIDQWNVYATMSSEKLRRIFEGDRITVKVKKVYVRSRFLKDMYVILYLLKTRHVSVRDLIRTTFKRIKDPANNFTPRVVWKWNKFGTLKTDASEEAGTIDAKIKMIETGND